MSFETDHHHRKSIRLAGFDYAQPGGYFVTIVTKDRQHLFGEVVNGQMILSMPGRIVYRTWLEIPDHYLHVSLDAFCVMPNHFHGIVLLGEDRRGGSVSDGSSPAKDLLNENSYASKDQTRPYQIIKRHGLPEIVRWFKSFSARRVNTARRTAGIPVWQRNYYEHIIRDQRDYANIVDYIQNNPANWENDEEY